MRLHSLLTAALISMSSGVFAACPALLDHSYRPLAKKEAVRLCDEFAGKVLLIVNTASKCGFTPQYEGLEALHQELSGEGFSVVGFPSNDFMSQEPGSEAQIAEFCTLTYGVKFPMFEKLVVKGEGADPLYRALAADGGGEPGWNFHKYLIGRDGKVVAGFGSRVKPDDAELREAIKRAMASSAPTAAR
jgi:glutathione peroxidase